MKQTPENRFAINCVESLIEKYGFPETQQMVLAMPETETKDRCVEVLEEYPHSDIMCERCDSKQIYNDSLERYECLFCR